MRHSRMMFACTLLVVTACGGSSVEDGTEDAADPTTTVSAETGGGDEPDTTTTAPQAETTPTTASGGDTSPAPEVGEAGSFTVNDTEFAVNLLNRCIPFSGSPDDLDLQALAQGAKLNLVLMSGTTEVSVDGTVIEEMFGSIAFGEDPMVDASSVSADRWTGSATVGDSLGSGESVDIVWDVMVPAEVKDCGL